METLVSDEPDRYATREDVQAADYVRLEHDVVEKIRSLAKMAQRLQPGQSGEPIFKAVMKLADFCADVVLMEMTERN